MRAIASSRPVTMPLRAAGYRTLSMVRQGYAPSAAEESFMPIGTRFSMSSVVLKVTGMANTANANAHHHDLVNKQTDDDRRRAQQDVVDEADGQAQARIPAVFGQVRARQHADRRPDQNSQQGHHAAAIDGIEQSPLAARGWCHLRKEASRHTRYAMRYQRPENGRQTGEPREGGDQGQRQERAIFDLAQDPPIHTTAPERRSSLRSIACAAAITVNVIRNNSNPSAMSAEVYMSPTASVNSLAIAEEMVVPGANKDELMRWALPITKVTAMVSPSARPNPSMMPPTIPTRECGTTTFQMTSQVVAPSP